MKLFFVSIPENGLVFPNLNFRFCLRQCTSLNTNFARCVEIEAVNARPLVIFQCVHILFCSSKICRGEKEALIRHCLNMRQRDRTLGKN